MNKLKRVVFIISMLILVTQTIRDVYVKWFEKRTSVLDRFDSPVERIIKEAGSLKELTIEYEIADKKVKDYEKDERNPKVKADEKWDTEPYKTKEKLRRAIEVWEDKSREIYELRFFWGCGLFILIIGLISYMRINNWLGISLIIIGFVEMIWWSSPCFSNFYGGEPEYNRLLVNKLVLSVITLVVLIWLWLVDSKKTFKTSSM